MAVASQRWSDESGPTQENNNGKTVWRATIAWDVIEAATAADATSVVPPMGAGHPIYGNTLFAKVIDPKKRGPNGTWIVTVTYSSESTGGDVNPLDRKARYQWVPQSVTENVDRDSDHHPLLNSAWDASITPQQNEFYDMVFYWTQWEPVYNPRRALSIINRINKDSFNIFGITINPLEALCIEYAPVGEIEEDATTVQCRYGFAFRETITDKISGWDFRFLDQGNRGFVANTATDTLKDQFYTNSKEPVSEPVLLRGDGTPVQSNFKVGKLLRTAKAQSLPPGAVLDNRFAPDSYFLGYQKKKRTNFKGVIRVFK